MQIEELTAEFQVDQYFRQSIDDLGDAMNLVISLYNHIQDYQNQEKFANIFMYSCFTVIRIILFLNGSVSSLGLIKLHDFNLAKFIIPKNVLFLACNCFDAE